MAGNKNGKYPGEEALRDRQRGKTTVITLSIAILALVIACGCAIYLINKERNETAFDRLIESLDANTRSRLAPEIRHR